MAPQVEGVENSKEQTTECSKADSRSPKTFLVCCFVAIRVQRLFVELRMTLL
jgi:hypothetical protein